MGDHFSQVSRTILVLAAVIIIAGMKRSASLLVPFLLSVPLTITVKLALDSKPETRWLGVLLGPA